MEIKVPTSRLETEVRFDNAGKLCKICITDRAYISREGDIHYTWLKEINSMEELQEFLMMIACHSYPTILEMYRLAIQHDDEDVIETYKKSFYKLQEEVRKVESDVK